jgi:hypothetical protein
MPFPLAHPAAVLPLRRYCPRHLSFSALVVGSLIPDLGYLFNYCQLSELSHRFLSGSVEFCLPVGFLALGALYSLRTSVVGVLPARYRATFSTLCQGPLNSMMALTISLLFGAWTHIFLDSFTHRDGWFVARLPRLQNTLFQTNYGRFMVCDLLYGAFTLIGTVWVGICYQEWLEGAVRSGVSSRPALKWTRAVSLGIIILFLALSSRGALRLLKPLPAGILTGFVVVGFLAATGHHLSE